MAIETAMNQIKLRWEETLFGIAPYRETKDRFILGDIDHISWHFLD